VSAALILFAHGSRVEAANQAVRRVAAEVALQGGLAISVAAFLELAAPDLAGAMAEALARGARRLVVVPYFLTLGTHLQRDLPRLVAAARAANGDPDVVVAPPLDGHPALAAIVLERFQAAQ
jgi:sirohydrochlorin ferrochelatase